MTTFICLNFAFCIIIQYHTNQIYHAINWDKFFDIFYFQNLRHQYFTIFHITGFYYGSEYLLLVILFSMLAYYFFKLLDQSRQNSSLNDLKQQKANLVKFTIFFIISFLTRSGLYFGLGYYKNISWLNNTYLRYQLYVIISTLGDAPNLFYMYLTHYRSFNQQE